MFGSVVLDVAIGMAFVFLLLSLIASVIQEMLATFMQLRAANLLRGLRSLFSGDSIWGNDLVDAIYGHGLIRGLFADPEQDLKPRQPVVAGADPNSAVQPAAITDSGTSWEPSYPHRLDRLRFWLRGKIGIKPEKDVRSVTNQLLLPAYIPSRTFALALIDILNRNKATGAQMMDSITQSLQDHHWAYRENKAGEALYALAMNAKGDIQAFQTSLENWYSDSMDRASGWYKRYTQRILLFIGFTLAVVFNVSSVRVGRTLWFDRDARVAMANAADSYVKVHPDPPKAVVGPTTAKDGGEADASAQSAVAASTSGDTSTSAEKDKKVDAASKAGDLEKKLQESAEAFNSATSSALLPVGWKHSPLDYWHAQWAGLPAYSSDRAWWNKFFPALQHASWWSFQLLLGWLVTACAISLGAPFWFDMLNKFMVVRGTVKPQEKSKTEVGKG